jgi:hypothetical protein
MRQRQRGGEILLDQHDGLSGSRKITAGMDEIAHDHRRELSSTCIFIFIQRFSKSRFCGENPRIKSRPSKDT